MAHRHGSAKGFSLVELSIVLVIWACWWGAFLGGAALLKPPSYALCLKNMKNGKPRL